MSTWLNNVKVLIITFFIICSLSVFSKVDFGSSALFKVRYNSAVKVDIACKYYDGTKCSNFTIKQISPQKKELISFKDLKELDKKIQKINEAYFHTRYDMQSIRESRDLQVTMSFLIPGLPILVIPYVYSSYMITLLTKQFDDKFRRLKFNKIKKRIISYMKSRTKNKYYISLGRPATWR